LVVRQANHVGANERRHHLDDVESATAWTWAVKRDAKGLITKGKDFCRRLGEISSRVVVDIKSKVLMVIICRM
jgi:hypothetical protein